MIDLQLQVFKKLNNGTLYNVPLVDDFHAKKYPNHWSQAIHPPTYKPNLNFDDKFLIGPLLEWLQCLVVSNIVVMKFEEKNPLPFGKTICICNTHTFIRM